MSAYLEYLSEIEERKGQNLDPKPIDSAELLSEIIEQIKNPCRSFETHCASWYLSEFCALSLVLLFHWVLATPPVPLREECVHTHKKSLEQYTKKSLVLIDDVLHS